MKKLLSILLVLCLALGLFAGCNNNADKSSSQGSESTPADESGAPAIQSTDDLAGKKIGVQLGTTGDIYASDIEGATVEQFGNGMEAVMALKQGKVDCVIIDDQPAKVFAQQNDDIMVLEEPFEIEDYALCLAKENADLTAAINGAIQELKDDGTLQAILDHYINSESTPEAAYYVSPEGTEYPNGELIMATNAQFSPYEYYGTDGSIIGVDADFAAAICDKLGYSLKIEDMAFDAIITSVQSGKTSFGAAGLTITEDRLKNVDFTDSYCTGIQVIIVKK